jgi:2-(1,2-epoxy-1,2-dihydrophenyl)acetyl-CoA isomerase
VVPDEQLLETVRAVALRLAAFAPRTVAALKANLNDALVLDLPVYLDVESRRFAENLRTRDAAEAARAYVEKRPPVFEGR